MAVASAVCSAKAAIVFAILAAIFPVFALIGAGALFGRMRKVGPGGVAVLNGFTVSLALPALLFRSLAVGDWRQLDQPAFVLAFGGGAAITFLIAFFLALPGARNGADRSLAALAASYSNTAIIGLPLMAGLIGPVGTEAAVIASLLTVSLLLAIAVLIVEIAGQQKASLGRAVLTVCKALSRNRLIVAAILLAALPTGTGSFMLAELYGREAALASRTILISTVLGAVTIAVLARGVALKGPFALSLSKGCTS
ncbi:hypothetical protein FHS31_000759 [Sphingomonas vulcanisoli]|uniref:AEC family transporter n=1 Tax=Sphingomonas vulcanisoli TaxID=1658060 RepID=A0ABX0TNS0_9SPHN|nr:AEC family transporter [Sphingomonas vulcanisoli]NIJ07177.1 hypothetical protein [Sphingomonas vulcanisoli]